MYYKKKRKKKKKEKKQNKKTISLEEPILVRRGSHTDEPHSFMRRYA